VISTAGLAEADAEVESDGLEDLGSLVEAGRDCEDVLAARHQVEDLPICIDGDFVDVVEVLP